MRKLIIGNKILTDEDIWICVEVGSNHCGDFELAKKMVITAAQCGADAVKFQKRDNEAMFTKATLQRSYNNEFSYGQTYGEHRQKLDWFGKKEFIELKTLAEKHGILFFATPFEEKSADFLHDLDMPLYKIASCDVTNIPLIGHVANFGKPMLISIGGASEEEIDLVYYTLKEIHGNFAFLHCVATYPNRDEDLNLVYIERLKYLYEDILIGFSSHHSSIEPLKEAYHLGARILEAHFTLNRAFKGTDHGFSLEPAGLAKFCEDVKRIKIRLGKKERIILEAEKNGFIKKMGKSIHIAHRILAGKRIEPEDIVIKAPADGLPPYEDVIGKVTIHDLSTADILTWEDLE